MSRTYHIGCVDCARHVWVGQRPAGGDLYLYTPSDSVKITSAFLEKHHGHHLEFFDLDKIGQNHMPSESVWDDTVEQVGEGIVEAMDRAHEHDQSDYARHVITRIRMRFGLGFVQNPGGGEFTKMGWRCQVPLHDSKEDLAILVAALKKEGVPL